MRFFLSIFAKNHFIVFKNKALPYIQKSPLSDISPHISHHSYYISTQNAHFFILEPYETCSQHWLFSYNNDTLEQQSTYNEATKKLLIDLT